MCWKLLLLAKFKLFNNFKIYNLFLNFEFDNLLTIFYLINLINFKINTILGLCLLLKSDLYLLKHDYYNMLHLHKEGFYVRKMFSHPIDFIEQSLNHCTFFPGQITKSERFIIVRLSRQLRARAFISAYIPTHTHTRPGLDVLARYQTRLRAGAKRSNLRDNSLRALARDFYLFPFAFVL